jgi:dipeptidase E
MVTANAIRQILLISNSTLFGSGFLDHAESEIRDFLKGTPRVLFVPFALHDVDGYLERVRGRFTRMGYTVGSLHQFSDKKEAVGDAEAIFVGGGNTFRLLKALYDFHLLPLIRDRVAQGLPYIGSSAGSNIAAPTIRTTNDMPIVEPPSLSALGIVPFQINPHYLDPDPNSRHMGETREERILQFLEENDTTVVGLREGAMIKIEGGSTTLNGSTGARIFRKGQEPIEVRPGTKLDEILTT